MHWTRSHACRHTPAPVERTGRIDRRFGRSGEHKVSQIFAGIRVIDLTQGMAGALVTMILADYGAEVIRLEPPGGDPMWEHPAYLLWNRGKKSVEVNWTTDAGRTQARQLVQSADVFIERLRPGEAEQPGLGS